MKRLSINGSKPARDAHRKSAGSVARRFFRRTARCRYAERFFSSFQFLKIPRIFPGDPNDTRLRNVEKEILIPQKMRDKARDEKCSDLVAGKFVCSLSGFARQNARLLACVEAGPHI